MIKIILIEDLPLILEGLKLLIDDTGDFKIVGEYHNGQEFIDDIDNIETDIVLTDIDMPVMDGITTTRMITSLKPEWKVIALSMHGDKKYYYEMITAGAKGFVLKQSSSKELEAAVRQVHSGSNYFSSELLQNVIVEMQGIEKQIIDEKKDILKLTERDNEMLQLICQGYSNKKLAEKLCLSISSIEASKSKLMKKTRTENTAGLIIWAIKNKLVEV